MYLIQLSSLCLVRVHSCPAGFPISLKELHLDGTDYLESSKMQDALQQSLLHQLTNLELNNMLIEFQTELIRLQNVQSLSLEDSELYAFPTQLQELTLLTCLNLSRSHWDSAQLTAFKAWPLLRVLKLDNCNLFGATTKVEAPRVQDLQVS